MLSRRLERHEQQLGQLIEALPVGIAAVLLAFGVDSRVTALTGLALFLWPWYVGQEGPTAEDDPSYAYLRSNRVKLYIVGLLTLLPLNGLAFFYSVLLAPIIVIVVGAILSTTFGMMLQRPLREINPNPTERENFKEMVFKTGGAAIFLSVTLLWIDGLALSGQYSDLGLIVRAPLFFVLAYLVGWAVIDREKSSRQYARQLADSLTRRNWWRQFEARKRHKMR